MLKKTVPRESYKSDLKFLNDLPGCRAEKQHGSPYGVSGLDIRGCINGRMFIIEKKKIGEMPTDRQLSRLRMWGAVGAITGWYCTRVELLQIFSNHGVVLLDLHDA